MKSELQQITEQQIWETIDILRGEALFKQDHYVILLLLSLYKDGIISEESNIQIDEIHRYLIENSETKLSASYLRIFDNFKPILAKISLNGLRDIIKSLFGISRQNLTVEFPIIFEKVLDRITKSQSYSAIEFTQPTELTRLICSLTDLSPNSKVFNPFAGMASFCVHLNSYGSYYGQEVNTITHSLGLLRIMAHNRTNTTVFDCENSIYNWPESSEKFDLILANPPFGVQIGQKYHADIHIETEIRTIEQLLIKRGVHSLGVNGKLIAVLPQSFLYKGSSDQRIRQYLVDYDLIETIISLPAGMLSHTGIPVVILVISKSKLMREKVRFIDGTGFVESKGSRQNVLQDQVLSKVILGDTIDSEIIRVVDHETIRENNFNLNVPRYFKVQIEGTKLGQIIHPIKGGRASSPQQGKLVRIRDLKDDKFNFKLDLAGIEDSEINIRNHRLLKESALLFATRWKNIKPTLFQYEGDSIFLSQDIQPFEVDTSKVDMQYLINELYSDYVEQQLESLRKGGIVPMISRYDLQEVIVKLPSLDNQRAKVQGILEVSDKIKTLEREIDALTHGKSVNQFNEFASLKHTLGAPRQNIMDWADNIFHFLNDNIALTDQLNHRFKEFYEIDINDALKEIKRDVNFMTEVLQKGENGLILKDYEKAIIPLSEINSLVKETSISRLNFKLIKLLLRGENLKERGIEANKTLLRTLFVNLLTNARKYAFDKKEARNELIIELQDDREYLTIEVRNNGKPFPQNFDRDKFISRFTTADTNAGTGLGGYDIHRIATEFNNSDWELILNQDPIYPVIFRFKFPIKLAN